MRHDLPPGTVTPVPLSMRKAAVPAPLIASACLALSNAPGDTGTAPYAINLTTVAVATDQDPFLTAGAQKGPSGIPFGMAASINQLWTTDQIDVILPRYPCIARWKTRRRGTWRFDRCRVCSFDARFLLGIPAPVTRSKRQAKTTAIAAAWA